jgi:hypothetical protein
MALMRRSFNPPYRRHQGRINPDPQKPWPATKSGYRGSWKVSLTF